MRHKLVKKSESEWTETETSYARFRKDGILEVLCKDGAEETLDTAKENLEIGKSLVGDHAPVPYLQVFGGVLNVTREAQRYYAESEDAQKLVTKIALVINSYISRVLGNLFLGLNRPIMPVKLFTDEEKALDWLQSKAGKA